VKSSRARIVLAVPVLIALIAVAILVARALSPHRPVIVGMVEGTQIDVAAKISGRVDSVFVQEGEAVHKGQILATLESREVDAKVGQAQGAMDAARARRDMAHHGARVEEREAVGKLYNEARHQFDLAEKTYNRIQALFADSVVSAQERDQVEFKYKAALEERDAARAKYEMVMNGARTEDVDAAEGLYHQAENAFAEASSYQQETHIVSRLDGEIAKRTADPGEMVAAGYPVFTLLDPRDMWVNLQLREDQMASVHVGSTLTAVFPALGNQPLTLHVASIAPMADFATWRATNQKGDFDLKTFEIKLRPDGAPQGWRPGMTAQVQL
jgi:HlyD family secretion protein